MGSKEKLVEDIENKYLAIIEEMYDKKRLNPDKYNYIDISQFYRRGIELKHIIQNRLPLIQIVEDWIVNGNSFIYEILCYKKSNEASLEKIILNYQELFSDDTIIFAKGRID